MEAELPSAAEIDVPALRTWKRYPAYKDSGVPWLGEVPADWEMKRLRWTITSSANGVWGDEPDGGTDDIGCVRVADFDRLRFRLTSRDLTIRSVPRGQQGGRLLEAGDLLIEKSGGGELQAVGAVVEYDRDGTAVCSNFVARLTVARGHDSRFLAYLHAALYAARVNTRSIKQTTGIQNLDAGAYLSELVALPGEIEQREISSLLDRQTAKIDALVGKKRQLLGLIEEKRAALIGHAVTRGLDPSVPMKESGVEWLGQVPAHWDVKRLKTLAEVRTGATKGRDLGDAETVELPYLRVANVQDGYLDLRDVTTIAIKKDEVVRFSLRRGDVLMNEGGMNEGGDNDKLGRGSVWNEQIEPCLHQNHVFAVRPKHADNSRWISTLTLTDYAKRYFMLRAKQSTNLASISGTNVKEFPCLMPPSAERQAILAHIGRETAKLDGTAAKVRRHVELLGEYRTALISAVVTGKIDVRGV